jgi:hypothetical protein
MPRNIFKFVDSRYDGKLRDIQTKFLETAQKNWDKYDVFVFNAPVGCHGKGERVLMYDGSSKAAEDIKVGDQLMGPDSKPRNVLSLCRGEDQLYKLTPVKGAPMIVNSEHILSLKRTPDKTGKQHKLINISVKDFLQLPKSVQKDCKLWRTGVEFNQDSQLPIDPYILGIWLGDGGQSSLSITSMDNDVIEAWTKWCESLGLSVIKHLKAGGKNLASTYAGITQSYIHENRRSINSGSAALRDIDVYYNKHIPRAYLVSSRDNRLQLLAGLLDTDGSLSGGGYDFIQKRKDIAEGVIYLARSLGLAAYLKECQKGCQTGAIGTYYRVSISGNCDIIPCRVPHKKSPPRRQKKDVTVVGFAVEKLKVGQYYGWHLDSDHLYLMEDFTVTHNSGKSLLATTVAEWRKDVGEKTAILTPRVMLQDQYTEEFSHISSLKGRARYICPEFGDCDRGYQLCESYCAGCPYAETRDKITQDKIGIFNFYSYIFGKYKANTLIIDEAHNTFDSISEIYTKYIYRCVEDYGDINTIGEAIIYLERKANDLEDLKVVLKESDDKEEYLKVSKELAHIYNMIDGVQASPKDFFFEKLITTHRGVKTEALRLQPITLNSLGNILFGMDTKVVLMSGTINNIDLRKLGLHTRRVLTIEEPSPIPVANRPVVYEPVANMAFKHQDASLPMLARRILDLAKTEQGKGVIHATYDLALKLQPYLESNQRFLFHTNKNKEAVYKKFRASKDPLILVAAGMAEGIDLPYDASRWQVITKVQYPSLADSLMAYFKDKEPDLYAWLTIRTIVQQCGRVCRGPDDFGITYIFDTCFENLFKFNKRLFPAYFKDSVTFRIRKSL